MILLRLKKADVSKTEKVLTGNHPHAKPFNIRQLMVVVLTRPMRMFLEPMILFTDLFLVLEYAMFFLYFESYPFIFKGAFVSTCQPLSQ